MSDTSRSAQAQAAQRVFYSYSRKDRMYCAKLRDHLALAEKNKLIVTWYDREILPGADWATEINNRLNEADIVLLLVSVNFVSSEYCWGKEMARALERHDAGECQVIPIIVRPFDFTGAPFARLQMLPSNGKPVSIWKPQDAAWEDTAKGIRRLAEALSKGASPNGTKSGPIVVPSHASLPLQASVVS